MEVSVSSLQNLDMSAVTLEQRIEIKSKGRPTPFLKMEENASSKGYNYLRKFNPNLYEKHNWLCGCPITNKLYCFTCLMFGGDEAWTRNGQKGLRHITDKINKHSKSKRHLFNSASYAFLGRTVGIQNMLSTAYHNKIKEENEQIRKNRSALSRIIDCVRFCGKFELALRGHNETEDAENPGIFLGLINFAKELDDNLKEHIDSATVFKGTSKTIQNELLQCMLEVIREHILKEVTDAKCVAIMGDETTDVSNVVQFVLILRYVDKHGDVFERFWGFFNPNGQDANSITQCIQTELHKILPNKDNDKLIAQAYDGASFMSGATNGVQAKIRSIYKYANYIHCDAHKLNLVMKKAASVVEKPRLFFANLDKITAFFSRSPQRNAMLDLYIKKRARVPEPLNVRWNSNSRTVKMVHNNSVELQDCFRRLRKSSKQDKTISDSRMLEITMRDKGFTFWLDFFYDVLPHVDILYNQLQQRRTDATQVKKNVENFITTMKVIREKWAKKQEQIRENDNWGEDSDSSNDSLEPPAKRTRKAVTENTVAISNNKIKDAIEVCDVIISHSTERFKFCDHLHAAELFEAENFPQYDTQFPTVAFNATIEAFPFLHKDTLKTELEILYRREEMRFVTGAIPLLKLLIVENLEEIFSEVSKLLRIVISMPMTTSEAERSFSTLLRIKTFLRNTMDKDRLNALAMLSTESSFISKIPEFNSKVIDKFASQRHRRMDFIYKEIGQF
jgi:hypothetical protein